MHMGCPCQLENGSIKLVKGLEHKSDKEWLRELGILAWRKGGSRDLEEGCSQVEKYIQREEMIGLPTATIRKAESLTPSEWTFGREQDKTAIALMKYNNSTGIRFGFQETPPAEFSTQTATVQKGFPGPYSTGTEECILEKRSISVHAKLDSVCVDSNLKKTPKPQMHIQSQYGMEEKNRKIASPIFICSRSRRMEDDAALAQPEAAGSAGPAAGR
ncbi:hypothetical protein TURU_038914 [Turdus rufiventris]|nr:hypothetical protein TURU_038914 [Turdus rufiventris]